MNKLFHYADAYLKQSNWKDIALIKLCLCAMGIMIGTTLPSKVKKPAFLGALAIFIATYIPLLKKFIEIAVANNNKQ